MTEELEPVDSEIEEAASIAYTAYCKAVGNVAWNGDELPTWEDFRADESKKKQSDAWIVAAQALLGSVGYLEYSPEDIEI